jgi:glycosyltransferase involved in cell wall biosynthesis
MTLIEAEAYGVPVLFCDPDMKEIVPEGGYVLTTSPEPSSIASAIDDLANYPEKIEQMSKVMIKHRNEVSASNRFKILDKILKEITH